METTKLPRKPVTYGKPSKRLPVQNIFEFSSQSPRMDALRDDVQQQKSRDNSREKRPLHKDADECNGIIADQPKTMHETALSTSSSGGESPASGNTSSPESHSKQSKTHATASLFEIVSSDEDVGYEQAATTRKKRRKLATSSQTGALKKNKIGTAHSTAANPKLITSKSPARRIDIPSVAVRHISPSGRFVNKQIRYQPPHVVKITSSQIMQKAPVGSRAKSEENSLSSGPTTPVRYDSPQLRYSGSPQRSDRSGRSSPATRQSPSHRRLLSKDVSTNDGTASPSQLGLKSLRLTPEKLFKATNEKPVATDIDPTQLTPRRGRQRLVDKLDSPRNSSRSDQTRTQPELTTNQTLFKDIEVRTVSQTTTHSQPQPISNRGTELDDSAETSRSSSTKAKMTYAQERSHLGDMLFQGNEDVSLPSTQGSSKLQSSQMSVYNSFGSQLELDDLDSDDPSSGGNLKSIHELRHAGANNRFERELEVLFEDIGSASANSKALRIQALTQLFQKLSNEDFLRRFLDSGMTVRLTTLARNRKEPDLLSSVILTAIFAILADADGGSVRTLTNICEAVDKMLPLLVEDKRPLSTIVRDRKQNLSKLLTRDILSIEAPLLAHKMWHGRSPLQLTSRAVALLAVELGLYRLRKLKNSTTTLTAPSIRQLLVFLKESSLELDNVEARIDVVPMAKRAMSSLEYACISPTFFVEIESGELGSVGRNIASYLQYASDADATLEHTVLRLLVSLSNDNSGVCEVMASTAVIDGVSAVVENNYPRLATSVDLGEELDQEKLDSVILALGCLLNFAENSGRARRTIHDAGDRRAKGVDWLAATFNDRVGKAAEATTVEQSQVVVGFGYLSMLLCTLCLDEDTRHRVQSRLNGQSLAELCVSAETFLTYLEKVDEIESGDQAMSRFTARFSNILATVATAAGLV